MNIRTAIRRTPTAAGLAGAALAVTLAGGLAAPAQAAPALNFRVPLTGTVSTSAGPLTVTGIVHVQVNEIPGNPIEPADPYRVHTNLNRVTLANTAVSCKATGADTARLATVNEPFTATYRIIPGNPVQPSDPCRDLLPGGLEVDYQLTVDGGEVTGVTAVVQGPVT